MAGIWGGTDERARAVAELATVVEANVDKLETGCRLPEPVVDAMRAAGVFRLPMPAAWGGPELPMLDIVTILEDLAYVEGAVGWCAMIGCDGGFYTAWLDDDVGRAMYPDLDAVTAGWVVPAGQAVPVDGGYRLTGRWSFGSGSPHADWFVSGALTSDTFEWRMLFVPAAEVEVLDGTWDTTGLRGTGSNDYRIDDVVVPAERTFSFVDPPKRPGSLYAYRATFAVKVAAVPLGLARRALDEVRAIAERKVVMPRMVHLRDLGTVQDATARAAALVASSRAYFHDTLARLAATLDAGAPPDDALRRDVILSASHAVQQCRAAIEVLADTVGTDGIRRSNRLERIRRDAATASTHIVGRSFEPCGRSLLGLDPEHPLF